MPTSLRDSSCSRMQSVQNADVHSPSLARRRRSLTTATSVPCSFSVTDPNAASGAQFILWGRLGAAPIAEEFPIYFAGGSMVFAPQWIDPGNPLLFTLTDNLASPLQGLVNSTPAPWSWSTISLPYPETMTIQGLIDTGTGSLAITNALILRTE